MIAYVGDVQNVGEQYYGKNISARHVEVITGVIIMTNKTYEIVTEIVVNGLVNEVYEILRQYREKEFEDVKHELSEHRATLKLIGKVTKDKTVKDILSD